MIKLKDPLRDATIQDLISWLEEHDPNKKYVYYDNRACLLCEFLKDHGIEYPIVTPFQWYADDCERVELPYYFDRISVGDDDEEDWTYGSALERARDFKAQTSGKYEN